MEEHLTIHEGEPVHPFTGTNATLGILILRFDTMADMLDKLDHMERHLTVEVC